MLHEALRLPTTEAVVMQGSRGQLDACVLAMLIKTTSVVQPVHP